LTAGLVLVTALGVAGMLWKYFDAEYQRAEAEKNAVKYRQEKEIADDKSRLAEEQTAIALAAERQAKFERDRAEGLLYASKIASGRSCTVWTATSRGARTCSTRALDYRGWEHAHLHHELDETHMTLRGHTDSVSAVGFSADGRLSRQAPVLTALSYSGIR